MADAIRNSRWFAKKSSRGAMVLGAWASGAMLVRKRHGGSVRVLTYHRFGHWPRDPFCVSEAAFEAQVRWVAEQGLAVSLEDFTAFLRGQRSLPEGAVMLTADDGAQSVLTRAAPILKHHGVPMVAYVTTNAIDARASRLQLPEPFLTWDEVGRLQDYGITIGSHGLTHTSLGEASEAQVREEAERSRDAIRRELGHAPTSFAYPYGTPAHYSEMSRRVLCEAGYETVFVSTHGSVRAGSDPLALRRIKVEGGEPLWLFKLLTRGGMDGWSAVDSALSLVQQARRRAPLRQKPGPTSALHP
jgi:peptidoglycan/xylan/chitin deacetylase (PgdA/CDA1 family)